MNDRFCDCMRDRDVGFGICMCGRRKRVNKGNRKSVLGKSILRDVKRMRELCVTMQSMQGVNSGGGRRRESKTSTARDE